MVIASRSGALIGLLLGLLAADGCVTTASAYRCGQSRPCAGGYNPYNPDSYNHVSQQGGHTSEFAPVSPGEIAKTVHAGENATLRTYYDINPDCTSRGPIEIRLTSQPANGRVSARASRDFPSFPQSNVRWVCDRSRVPVEQVIYRASAGFTGQDGFDVQILGPDHNAKQVHFTVTVE